MAGDLLNYTNNGAIGDLHTSLSDFEPATAYNYQTPYYQAAHTAFCQTDSGAVCDFLLAMV